MKSAKCGVQNEGPVTPATIVNPRPEAFLGPAVGDVLLHVAPESGKFGPFVTRYVSLPVRDRECEVPMLLRIGEFILN